MRNHIQLILLPSKTRRSFIHSALIRVEKEKKEERRKKKGKKPHITISQEADYADKEYRVNAISNGLCSRCNEFSC